MGMLAGITGLEVFADEWPHPARRGEHYRALQEELTGWLLSFGAFAPDRADLFVKSDYPLLATLAWPDADRSKARDICALAATLASWDDEADDEREEDRAGAVAAELRSLRGGFSGTQTKWEPLYRSILEGFAARMPARQFIRFTGCLERYIEGCLHWAGLQLTAPTTADVEEYARNRHLTVGQPIDMVLVEYALGIDLDDDILQDATVRRLQTAHVDYVWLMQDLLSYRKEVATGATSNIITVLAASGGGDVQAAVDQTHHVLRTKISDFEAACAELGHSPLGDRRELQRYIQGLKDFTSGFVQWTIRSPRYDPDEYACL
ncbi:hypothetical protein [Kitasatospora sp. NPDC085879]|uniref:terpene synthase family protein n=1 Tax=Kitasatospora sp. NPDC085879 TaxID=3154769 RepID=UPI003449D0C9